MHQPDKISATIRGVKSGEAVFCGPEFVQIDITNSCNQKCLPCWCHSPLLGDKSPPLEWKKMMLPLDVIKSFVDDLVSLGKPAEILLSGGGEPTLHPHFKEIVEYIKERDIRVGLNTNFSTFNEEDVQWCLDVSLDLINVSLWAGTAGAYTAGRFNQTEAVFHRIVKLLGILGRKKSSSSIVSLHNVLFKANYDDILNMLDLACQVKADQVRFNLIDPVPGYTESLLLNEGERLRLSDDLKKVKQRLVPILDKYRCPQNGATVKIAEFKVLERRVKSLWFTDGMYDQAYTLDKPCYIGWVYTRILTGGEVVPCCKGHRMLMGNLYQTSFKQIWKSQRYNNFRRKAFSLGKNYRYFSLIGNDAAGRIGCYNCDNIGHNQCVARWVAYDRWHVPINSLKFLSFFRGILSRLK